MFWEDALKSGAGIIITSFNELHEGTEIEPTREYGFMFLNITREYCRKLKEVHEEKAPQIKFSFSISRDGKNLSMNLVNEGGPAIAVELSSLPRFVKPFSKYLQNGKVLIPLIGEGETYRVNFSLENASLRELRISFLLSFYSASGHLYQLETNDLPVAFLVNVTSSHGIPKGSGWYIAGSKANISVEESVPDPYLWILGGKYVFEGWTGDVESTSAKLNLTVDSPKLIKARWRHDLTTPLIISAVVLIFILILIKRVRPR
jgi:hypothetical protein